MSAKGIYEQVANSFRLDVGKSSNGARKLRLKNLLKAFSVGKRSDSNTVKITESLNGAGLTVHPPIVRFGDDWELSRDDWIYLTLERVCSSQAEPLTANRGAGSWFDQLSSLELRTEKEVENKFILPLLARLGYSDSDRFDGMPVPAAHGSKSTTLVIDFALFNREVPSLAHQPILTVEAKKEGRLTKRKEILNAHNQAKSYCMWTQCDFFLITDGGRLQLFHISRGRIGEPLPVFSCEVSALASRFDELYSFASKEALTKRYLLKFSAAEDTE